MSLSTAHQRLTLKITAGHPDMRGSRMVGAGVDEYLPCHLHEHSSCLQCDLGRLTAVMERFPILPVC